MTEEPREGKKYIISVIVIACIIAGVIGYGYLKRQARLDSLKSAIENNDICGAGHILNQDRSLVNEKLFFEWRNGKREWMPPLSVAFSAEMTALLIEYGADVNARNFNGLSVLHCHICYNRNSGSIKLLISKGADLNALTTFNETPLHLAVYDGDISLIKYLLSLGVSVNTRHKDGTSPLETALDHGFKEVAELLRQHGAKK